MTTWDAAALAGSLAGMGLPVTATGAKEVDFSLSGDSPDDPRPTTARVVGSGSATTLVHLDLTYPFTAPDLAAARLGGAVLAPHLLLGRTEVDDDGSVHHRYAFVVDEEAGPTALVLAQVVSVLDFEQLHFGDYLEVLCGGRCEIEDFARFVEAGEASGID